MPFKKGQSGNPGGKHKEKIFRNALLLALKEAGEDMPALRDVAHGLIERAKKSDPAAKELADRLDGKVPQGIVGDDDSDPLQIITKIALVAPGSDEDRD